MSRFELGDYSEDDVSRDDFFRKAIHPNFPNHMQFVLSIPPEVIRIGDEDLTFSHEGIDALTEQIGSFIMARILGTWRKTNAAPHELTVDLDLSFKALSRRELREGAWPWWALVDEGKTPLDGGHRGSHERR